MQAPPGKLKIGLLVRIFRHTVKNGFFLRSNRQKPWLTATEILLPTKSRVAEYWLDMKYWARALTLLVIVAVVKQKGSPEVRAIYE